MQLSGGIRGAESVTVIAFYYSKITVWPRQPKVFDAMSFRGARADSRGFR